jgi:hypothetical protein
VNCPDCSFVAKSPAGLAAHRRKTHPPTTETQVQGPNVKAIEVTLGELRQMGRLEAIDEARVQALRSMAWALDHNPFNSQMWREYREAIEGLTAHDGDSGSIDELLDELSTSVRDKT